MIKIALNGGQPTSLNPNVPVTLAEYAEELLWFTQQGVEYFHIHFRDEKGYDTLEQSIVQPQYDALKARFPEAKIGIGSPLLFGRTQRMRMDQVSRWDGWKPDFISVNLPEEGIDEFIALLREKEVPMEMSCFSMEDAYAYEAKNCAADTHRVLIEVSGEKDGPATVEKAKRIYEYLHERYPDVEYVIHGEDIHTWEVIHYAKENGYNWRIGLEDVATDEHGEPIATNRELYLHALEV